MLNRAFRVCLAMLEKLRGVYGSMAAGVLDCDPSGPFRCRLKVNSESSLESPHEKPMSGSLDFGRM